MAKGIAPGPEFIELLEQFAAEVEIPLNREDQAFYRSPSVNAVSRDRQVDTWPR